MAWNVISTICTLSLLCCLTHQMPQEDATAPNNAVNELSPTNCSTARGQEGVCVERQICDYGTSAVDKSLYAPKGYTRPCKMHEVCCPLGSINLQPEPTNEMRDDQKELSFDPDD